MEAVIFGTRTANGPGQFCKRVVSGDYFIGHFETPFLYERDGELVEGAAGELLIIPPGMPVYHGPRPGVDTGYINDWIYLRGSEMGELLARYPLPVGAPFPAGRGTLRRYIENVGREYAARLPGYQEQAAYLTGQLVIELYRQNLGGQGASDAASRMLRAREEILSSPEKPWTLAEMAALSGYSVSRFSALYRERFGCSAKQELLTARVELAAKLLRYTGATVTEVADACGFQNIFYFSKYFKAAKGVSPKAYAEQG